MAGWARSLLSSESRAFRGSAVARFGIPAVGFILFLAVGWTSVPGMQSADSRSFEEGGRQTSSLSPGRRLVEPPGVASPSLEVTVDTLTVQIAEGRRIVRDLPLENSGTAFASWAVSHQESPQTRRRIQRGIRSVGSSPPPRTHRQQLRQKAADDGHLRVLATVDVDYTPEKGLPRTAVNAQRQRITAVQERVLAGVQPHASSVWASDIMPILALEVDEEGLERLLARPEVVRVVEDKADPVHLETSTEVVGATEAWEMGYDGEGQVVVVLDAGISGSHPFLEGQVVEEACFSSESAGLETESLCPDGTETQFGPGVACNSVVGTCGHGTHVAGIAAGRGQGRSGVAPEADLVAVQVFSRFNSDQNCGGEAPCYLAFRSDQLQGLEYAYQLRNEYSLAAVNMSLGSGRDQTYCPADSRATIIRELRRNGIATVVSTGNNGFSMAVGAPACISTTIAVGSTQDGTNGARVDEVSSFSNSAWMLDFLAPGERIESSVGMSGYQSATGTSMSAPHVAGAWAILKSRWPSASVDEIQARLDASGVFVTDSRNEITRPRLAIGAALREDNWLIAGPTYGSVPPGQTEDLSIVIDASSLSPGIYEDTFAIATSDQGVEEEVVHVEVLESGPARAEVAPGSVMEATRTGRPIEIVQTITNAAGSTGRSLEVQPILPDFLTQDRVIGGGVLVTDSTISVPPQTTATMVYRFEETAERFTVFEDTIRFETNDPAAPTVRVPTEIAVRVPRIAVAPSELDFGVVSTGESSISRVTLTNVGSASFTATGDIASGPNHFVLAQSNGTVSISPGESREMRIRSEALDSEIRKGRLHITHDAVNVESPIRIDLESAPDAYILRPPYPNPLRTGATIEYSIPEPVQVRVDVYDLLGRRVAILRHRQEVEGVHRVHWKGRSTTGQPMAAGPYFVRLRAGEETRTERLTIVR